eukprot:g33485.t1
MDAVDAVEIQICVDNQVKDGVCMQSDEMRAMPELAFHVICQRVEQALCGKVLKRITYIDDEGDACTLTKGSLADALDQCRNGLLYLHVVEEPQPSPQQSNGPSEDENIPEDLMASTLIRSEHIVPTNTSFRVEVPAGAAIYIFSEAHRDGGFPALGWQKCDAKRFRWEQKSSGKSYALSLWKCHAGGVPVTIPVNESLVGGIAVKVTTPYSQAEQALRKLYGLETMKSPGPTCEASLMETKASSEPPELAKAMEMQSEVEIPAPFALTDMEQEKTPALELPKDMPEPKQAWLEDTRPARVDYPTGRTIGPCFVEEEEMLPAVISEAELDPKVAAAALAKLMSSTNASLREAAHRAFSEAALEVALRTASSKPGSPSQESGSDISDDWERLDGVGSENTSENEDWQMDVAPQGEQPHVPFRVKVVFVSHLLSDTKLMKPCNNLMKLSPWQGAEAFLLEKLEIHHAAALHTTKALVKIVVVNDGAEAWPEVCALKLQEGPSWGFLEMPLGPVKPGETVELVMDLAFNPGTCGETLTSAWAVVDENDTPLGPPLLLEVMRT